MAAGAVAGLCRIVVRSPESSFELTVPTDVPLVDLLPAVVGYAGDNLADTGVEHGGWVLQRLGGAALDEESTFDALGLHDGDVLYLRPRRDELPAIHFDDLVDGVATALRSRSDAWGPELSRRLLLTFVLSLLGTSVIVLALPGPALPRALVAAAVAVLLMAGAASAAHAVGDVTAGAALGAMSLPFIALTAGLLPTGIDPDILGARLFAGGAAATGMAAVALAVVGAATPLFLSAGLMSAVVAGAGAVMMTGAPIAQTAAAASLGAVILGVLVPGVSFRLSGLRLPPLPANSEQLQEGIEPHDAGNVLSRSAVAGQYVTALYVAIGAIYVACLTGLSTGTGWPVLALLAVLSLLAIVHGRALGSVPQRLAVMLPGAYGAVLFALGLAAGLSPTVRFAVVVGCLAVAAGLAIASWTVPGRRMLPHWGHAANILHSATAISVLPLVLMVFGVFHAVRGAF